MWSLNLLSVVSFSLALSLSLCISFINRLIPSVLLFLLSHVWLFATPWTAAHQAPPSMGFSRQEDWSGVPFPSPGDLPDPGLLHCRQIRYHLSRQGKPFFLLLKLNLVPQVGLSLVTLNTSCHSLLTVCLLSASGPQNSFHLFYCQIANHFSSNFCQFSSLAFSTQY